MRHRPGCEREVGDLHLAARRPGRTQREHQIEVLRLVRQVAERIGGVVRLTVRRIDDVERAGTVVGKAHVIGLVGRDLDRLIVMAILRVVHIALATHPAAVVSVRLRHQAIARRILEIIGTRTVARLRPDGLRPFRLEQDGLQRRRTTAGTL